jgi:serine protease AprX
MKRSHKFLHLVLAFTFLPVFAWINWVSSTDQLENMHPMLTQIAANSPDQVVSVIVQLYGDPDPAEGLVASLGGAVTRDLSIINAFSAELPAKAVPELAQSGGVRWVSLDAPVEMTVKPPKDPLPDDSTSDGGIGGTYAQVFLDTMNVRAVWDMGLHGEGIGVAVIDSGITQMDDFSEKVRGRSASRIVRQETINPNSTTVNDVYGHGTHIAGIIGGNGKDSDGLVSGVAPMADFISLKVSDEQNVAFESDAVAAMQWVLENKETYNIRVVNLSIAATQPQSYHTSPIDAAAEILWFNGIVVVTSAGNYGPDAVNFAPANDPFIITVGASDERQTAGPTDDTVAPYSAYGVTLDGFIKPDIIAPGQDIVSLLSSNSSWGYEHPDRLAYSIDYFRLSGTSMSAPMVAGAAALLLQDEPELTPDQVKYRLMNSGPTIRGSDGDANSYPYLDVYAVITGSTAESANTGTVASQLLWTGDEPVNWESVNWNSVNWNSVNWNSVNWNSVNWNSVNWNSVAWDY